MNGNNSDSKLITLIKISVLKIHRSEKLVILWQLSYHMCQCEAARDCKQILKGLRINMPSKQSKRRMAKTDERKLNIFYLCILHKKTKQTMFGFFPILIRQRWVSNYCYLFIYLFSII